MRLWKLSHLLILGIAWYGTSSPCSWVEHLAPPAQSTAPEKLPFVSFEKAKEYIRAIFEQADPTAQLQIPDESGQIKILSGFRFIAEKIGLNIYAPIINGIARPMTSGSRQYGNMSAIVRYEEGIGYVFETSKTIGGEEEVFVTARYINGYGDYADLDKLPLSWIQEVNTAFEKGEMISSLKWQKIISFILNQKHPEEPLRIETESGEKYALTGFGFRVNKVPFYYYEIHARNGIVRLNSGGYERGDVEARVRYEPGIGYVFETEKTIEGSTTPVIETRYISSQGKYEVLDRIPPSWLDDLNRTLETGEFISSVRWRMVIDFMLHRHNPSEPVVIEAGNSKKQLVGFRFKVYDVGERFFQPSVSPDRNLMMVSGSKEKCDMTVMVRYEPNLGYVFETEKIVKGREKSFVTARYINSKGEYVDLDTLPFGWVEELNESLVTVQPVSKIRWQKVLTWVLNQDPLGKKISVRGKDNRIQRLNGFRFQVGKNIHIIFRTALGRNVNLRSGSREGHLLATVIYDEYLKRYVVKTEKYIAKRKLPFVNYRMLSDGRHGRNFYYAYRKFIGKTEHYNFINFIKDYNRKISGQEPFTKEDENILIQEVRKGNKKAYQIILVSIDAHLVNNLGIVRDDRHKDQWPAVEHLASEVVLSYGQFGPEKHGLIEKTIRRIKPVVIFNIYLMERLEKDAILKMLALKENGTYDKEKIFSQVRVFAREILNVLKQTGGLEESEIAQVLEWDESLEILARFIRQYEQRKVIQGFRTFIHTVLDKTPITVEEILRELSDELLKLIAPADGKVKLNFAL